MKKILFASTALVAFAGAAAAEVTLTGNAELGIFSNDSLSLNGSGDELNSDNTVSFLTDIDVTFTMSGETDNGLVFGASVDLDENDAFGAADQGGETIFISGAFGQLTGGDTDGALDFALTEVAFNGGSLADDETAHAGYNGNSGLDGLFDGQIVRYDFSTGNFAIAVSAELDDGDGEDNDDVLGIGVTYDLDLGGTTIGLGAGFQTAEFDDTNVDTFGLSANASFGGGFTAGVSYMEFGNHIAVGGGVSDNVNGGAIITPGEDTDHIGVGVGYSQGPISVNVNYGEFDHDLIESDGYGLSVGYDLGGGAVIQFGYGHSDIDIDGIDVDDVDTMSFGVRMNF